MNKAKDLFYSLLRNALWLTEEELSRELPVKTAQKILKAAEEQAVSGLVIDALIRKEVKLRPSLVYDAYGLLMQIQQGNGEINKKLKGFVGLMEAYRVKYVVVKGQVVASYYPNTTLRQSGDIDYYCDPTHFQKSQQTIKDAWGIEAEANGSEQHVHFDYQGVDFEGHFSLISFYNKKQNRYWQKILDEDGGAQVEIDGIQVRTLSPTLHTLYIFLHLYHHLLELGVGLRQFCDLAVMLHYCRQDIDHETLRRHLRTLGLEKAFRACGSILVDKLGLPKEDFCCELSDNDRKYGRRILDVVFYRGNMGHYNKKNGFSGWKHNVEATGIKVSHFLKFMALAPGFSCRWLGHELGRKVRMKVLS